MSPQSLPPVATAITTPHTAAQHKPRPLPLFLELLRSETAGTPQRTQAALKGLAAYQRAERPERPPPMPAAARAGRATLLDYGGEDAAGPPVIFVPSLINPPYVLDLDAENSLLRWLAGEGLRPMLVDWGAPLPEESGLSIAGHVEALLLPLIDALGEPPLLAGYCLGGTMALAAAARRPVAGLAMIAAPWRFSGFPVESREGLLTLWDQAESAAEILGMLPMEVLQTAFWRLDPARTVQKFERFGGLDPASEAAHSFIALEDWANDGFPLTLAAARELAEGFFRDDLTGTGAWRVAGSPVDPAALGCPVLEIISTTDRIVPAASAAGVGERIALGLGHVGMVVGGRAKQSMWQPLARWLSQARDCC